MMRRELNDEERADAKRLYKAWRDFKSSNPHATQQWVAERCGWKTQGAVTQYFNAKIPINIHAAIKFATIFGVSIGDISPRLEKEYGRLASTLDGSLDQAVSEDTIIIQPLSPPREASSKKAESSYGEHPATFDQKWLRDMLPDIDPTCLRICCINSEAMRHTIEEFDYLLVDVSVSDYSGDGVYAFMIGGDFYLRRLQKTPDDFLLMVSDNKTYESFKITKSIRARLKIMGRAIMIFKPHRI